MGNGVIRTRVHLSPGAETLAQMIDGVTAEATDWMPLWPTVVETVIEGVKRVVASRGAELSNLSFGHAWQRPDAEYSRRKARAGRGAIDMVFTGETLAKVETPAGVLQMTPKMLVFGIRGDPKVQYLNFAKRPFLGMSAWMEETVQVNMQAFLDAVIARAFAGAA